MINRLIKSPITLVIALYLAGFQSAYAETKMIRCLYVSDSDAQIDLIFDLAKNTAEVRTKVIGKKHTYAAEVQEFPTTLRFTWNQDPLVPGTNSYDKITLDVDRSTLNASRSKMEVGGVLSGHVYASSSYTCTVEKAPKVKNKI